MSSRFWWLAIAFTLAGAAERVSAAAAVVARGDLLLDLPPGPSNPRNSEGAFIATHDGGLLLVYSRFVGEGHHDNSLAYLAARRSQDGGKTWTKDEIVVRPQDHERVSADLGTNVMSVSLVRMQNGELGLFYLLRRGWHDMRMQLRRSGDEGRTWSAPIQCFPTAGYFVVNNDRVIRLASGRLAIPAAWHRQLADLTEWSKDRLQSMEPWTKGAVDRRGIFCVFTSDDDGRTWQESANFCVLNNAHTDSGLQEPGLVQLTDGALWAWARTDMGRQYEAFSRDEGRTWSEATPSRFTSPNSPLSLKRIPGTERFLAVWNPAPRYETRPLLPAGGDRTPLVAAVGTGPTVWSKAVVIEGDDGVDAGYHYCAIHFLTAETALLAYCAGNAEDKHRLNRLRVRIISIAAGNVPFGNAIQ